MWLVEPVHLSATSQLPPGAFSDGACFGTAARESKVISEFAAQPIREVNPFRPGAKQLDS